MNQFIFIFILIISFLSCKFNPLGENHSQIEIGNTPFLGTPESFFATPSLGNLQVNLNWTDAKNADDYSVSYGTSSGIYENIVDNCTNIKTTSCIINNLKIGTKYYFKVTARNIFGSINAKNEAAITCCQRYLYVSNSNDNSIYYCQVSDDGSLSISTCGTAGSGFSGPTGIAILNSGAYISNLSNNSVTYCQVSGTGIFYGCSTASAGFSGPNAIVVDSGYIYVLNTNLNSVSSCEILGNGILAPCITAVTGFDVPLGLTIKNGFAYISNANNNTVSSCAVSNGLLSSCNYVAAGGFVQLAGIDSNNDYLFVTNFVGNSVSSCVLGGNGVLPSCLFSSAFFSHTSNISVGSNGFAYVSNSTTNNVSACLIGTNGVLTSCNAVYSNTSVNAVKLNF